MPSKSNLKRKAYNLKSELDKTFSRYIRLKHAFGVVREKCRCITCGKVYLVGKIQAGHYVPRNHLATRWDERNVHPQCVGCNVWGNGKSDEYAIYIQKTYGDEVLAELHQAKHTIKKISTEEMAELIEHYQKEIAKP